MGGEYRRECKMRPVLASAAEISNHHHHTSEILVKGMSGLKVGVVSPYNNMNSLGMRLLLGLDVTSSTTLKALVDPPARHKTAAAGTHWGAPRVL